MKYPIPCDDDETSIEQYEDVVAYTMEGDFYGVRLGSEKLSDINALFIWEYAAELLPDKSLTVKFSSPGSGENKRACTATMCSLYQFDDLAAT